MTAGSVFSNSTALGTKSTSDQIRIAAWLSSATSNAIRPASSQPTMSAAISSTSNAV